MKKKKVITIVLTVIFISIIFIGLFFFQSQRSRAFSESNCTTLGWSTAGGSASVCGESDASPLAGCSGALNWSAAVSFCEAVGARLCTKAEIDADEAAGTGCSYDSELVWTSTRCDDYGSYWRIEGKNGTGPADTCSTITTSSYVRCCGDVDNAVNLKFNLIKLNLIKIN